MMRHGATLVAGLVVLAAVTALLMLLYLRPELQLLWFSGLFGCG